MTSSHHALTRNPGCSAHSAVGEIDARLAPQGLHLTTAQVEPIMGAGYHAIHHTTYKHNYGQFFVYMDQLFGTLTTPRQYAESLKSAAPFAGSSDHALMQR